MLKVSVEIVPDVARKFVVVTDTEDKLVITPLEEVRLIIVPEVARRFVPVAEVKDKLVIVPLVELSVVIVPFAAASVLNVPLFAVSDTPVALANPRFVANKFVLVVLTPVALTQVKPVTPSVSTARLVKAAFVANKFVLVEFTETTSPSSAFQRCVASPKEKARSAAGSKFEFTKPVTAKFVVVPLVIVVF